MLTDFAQRWAEIGGGLNFRRKQFLTLVDRIILGEVSTLIVAHKDRLARFGFELLQHLCRTHDCKLLVIDGLESRTIMVTTHIDEDAVILNTRIPESGRVDGLDYGAHVSMTAQGWCGYYVRPAGTNRWGVARLTPASNELVEPDEDCGETQDEAIVRAIREELS